MTTFAPNQETLDQRTRAAWNAYRNHLVALEGLEYDAAEADCWERLQQALQDIETDRVALSIGGERHT
jgi:hypothetical protein